ncbi:MAG TPA: hypothetical protein DCR15_06760 [Arthrobacter bacterium]|nr:hypothetical protein [Arthrobacter sp.]
MGQQRVFMALLEPVLPGAFRLAFGMLRSEADAEDAVQESVLSAWRHFKRFRPGSDVRPWLLKIVANQCRGQPAQPLERGGQVAFCRDRCGAHCGRRGGSGSPASPRQAPL